jgi:hypothetical protein
MLSVYGDEVEVERRVKVGPEQEAVLRVIRSFSSMGDNVCSLHAYSVEGDQ